MFATGIGKSTKIPHWISNLGAAGVFGAALWDASPVPLPIPGSADLLILIFAANQGNPVVLAGVGVLGSSIGAYLTWAAGKKGGDQMIERRIWNPFRSRVERWSKKYGVLSVFAIALAPPPLPTLPFLLAAGAGGTKARKAIPAFAAARVIRFGLEGYLGWRYGRGILALWTTIESSEILHVLLWVLVGLVVCGVGFGAWKFIQERRKKRREDKQGDKQED